MQDVGEFLIGLSFLCIAVMQSMERHHENGSLGKVSMDFIAVENVVDIFWGSNVVLS